MKVAWAEHVSEWLAAGGTPLVRLRSLEPHEGVRFYAKLEGQNPTGSIKDRVAVDMVRRAEEAGLLTRGSRVVEASSGNTGIGLARVCRQRGYGLTVVMSRKASRERIALLGLMGVDVVLTSRKGGADEARRVADDLASERRAEGWVRLSQHRDGELVAMHARWTAREIIDELPHQPDYLVAGIGTGATVMGVGTGLRAAFPGLQVVGVQPRLALSEQEGLRNVELTVPAEIYDASLVDEVVTVADVDAKDRCRRVIAATGLLVGLSSGSVLAAAQSLVARGRVGNFVVVFPDRVEKYLSTKLVTDEE